MDGDSKNYKKVIRSRNGVKVTLDDQDGQEKIILETPGGQKIALKDGPRRGRDCGQQRQFREIGVERNHHNGFGKSYDQRFAGRGVCRNGNG